jgi:hypothetical protein
VGAATLDGHQIGSLLARICCASCVPNATLSPFESTITTFVPLGTCESELDEPLFELRPFEGEAVCGVVPLSAKTGAVATALRASISRTVNTNVACCTFLFIFAFSLFDDVKQLKYREINIKIQVPFAWTNVMSLGNGKRTSCHQWSNLPTLLSLKDIKQGRTFRSSLK